jgi:hypothetical protein
MREFKRYAFLFFAVMLFSVAKAGDKEWTLNANGTEWLYTHQTKTKQVYIKEGDDYYSVYGVIQLSFRNDKDESRIANDRWTDYAMRVGNIDGFNSSGYVSVYVYYNNQWNLRNDIACGFYYYNSDPDNDGNWQFTKNKIEPNYWFDMDVQSGIKLYFEDGNGNKLETVSPTRPRDLETPRWSTTEGTIRHYRTNLYNDFDKDFLSLNKSVRFAKKSGDGTYLFNPVWGQFSKGGYIDQDDPGTGSVTAKNVYVPNALDWTGEITSESVVESPIDEYGKYTLSIAAPFPMTAYKYRTDPNRHFMTQAIVHRKDKSYRWALCMQTLKRKSINMYIPKMPKLRA